MTGFVRERPEPLSRPRPAAHSRLEGRVVEPGEIEPGEIKPSEIELGEIELSEIKLSEIKIHEIKIHEPNPAREKAMSISTKIRAAAVVAVAVGAVALPTAAANASGENWAASSGSCYGWTTFTSSQVTGHVYDHSNDTCAVTIYQYNESTGLTNRGTVTVHGAGASGSTAAYNYGGNLEVFVCAQDLSDGAGSVCSPDYT